MKKTLLLSLMATVAIFAGNVEGSLSTQGQLAEKGIQDKMFATYGNVKYTDELAKGISFGINFYGVSDFGLVDMKNQMPGYMKNGNGYAILNEAYLKTVINKTEIKAGRFQLNEGVISSGDSKYDYVVPNAFEGISISRACGPFNSKFAWINKMSGRDNLGIIDSFRKVEDIAKDYTGLNKDTNGAFFGRISYSNGLYDGSIQDLYVDNYSNSFLGEIGYKAMPNLKVSGQVLRNTSKNHFMNTTALGLKATWSVNPELSAELAYNHVGKRSINGFLFGADPLYTSGTFANAYNDNHVNAVRVSGTYKLNDKTDLNAGYLYSKGDFYKRKSGELGATYSMSKALKVKAVAGCVKENGDRNIKGKAVITYSF